MTKFRRFIFSRIGLEIEKTVGDDFDMEWTHTTIPWALGPVSVRKAVEHGPDQMGSFTKYMNIFTFVFSLFWMALVNLLPKRKEAPATPETAAPTLTAPDSLPSENDTEFSIHLDEIIETFIAAYMPGWEHSLIVQVMDPDSCTLEPFKSSAPGQLFFYKVFSEEDSIWKSVITMLRTQPGLSIYRLNNETDAPPPVDEDGNNALHE